MPIIAVNAALCGNEHGRIVAPTYEHVYQHFIVLQLFAVSCRNTRHRERLSLIIDVRTSGRYRSSSGPFLQRDVCNTNI